jgi:hypothetical protein
MAILFVAGSRINAKKNAKNLMRYILPNPVVIKSP